MLKTSKTYAIVEIKNKKDCKNMWYKGISYVIAEVDIPGLTN